MEHYLPGLIQPKYQLESSVLVFCFALILDSQFYVNYIEFVNI